MKKTILIVLVSIMTLSLYTNTFALSSDQRTALIKTAQNEFGEGYDNNGATKYGIWYGDHSGSPTFTRGFLWNQHTDYWANQQWCTMFVCWCADKAGLLNTVIPFTASVPVMQKWYQDNGRFRDINSYTPTPGDIIFFKNNNNEWQHVGLVQSVNIISVPAINYNETILTCIEGDCFNPDTGRYEVRIVERKVHDNNGLVVAGYGVN